MFVFDSLAIVSIVSFLILAAVAAAAAPRQEFQGRGPLLWLFVVAGTTLAYSAATMPVFLAGWTIAGIPFLLQSAGAPRLALIASTLGLAASVFAPNPFALFAITLLRQGVFPFQRATLDAFESPSLPMVSLYLNSHLGAYLLMRFTIPLFPAQSAEWLAPLGALALMTSVLMAIAAVGRPHPRRTLGLLWISQAAFLVAGIGNRSEEGITGALVHWWVVAFAMNGLMAAYRAMEARHSGVRKLDEPLGLGQSAPRLAVYFAVSALALVGLPGTLGFVAEDLLFHGALNAHFVLGVALPVATALNAITVFRFFSTIFMGRRAIHTAPVPDASRREAMAFTATALLLFAGGLAPSVLVTLRTPSAQWLAQILLAAVLPQK